MMRIVNVVGTRPNLVKMAALISAQRAYPDLLTPLLLHTGQHRSPSMSSRFLAELQLPEPDIGLSFTDGDSPQPVEAMVSVLERVIPKLEPDLAIVVGDVNSTAAGALAASRLGIPVAHVEAGLRSFDNTMPEESNRILVDSLSDLLFASEESAVVNLNREGHPARSIHHVGNVMIDTLVRFRGEARNRCPARAVGIDGDYCVLTLHRPSNVDFEQSLASLLRAVGESVGALPIIFPAHPRTRQRLDDPEVGAVLAAMPGLRVVDPLGYLDMLALLERARLVLTDSGGLQEESTFLGVPCLTLRESTERPATVTHGTNRVVGTCPTRIREEIAGILDGSTPSPRCPPLWDGKAAERIVEILEASARTRPSAAR